MLIIDMDYMHFDIVNLLMIEDSSFILNLLSSKIY